MEENTVLVITSDLLRRAAIAACREVWFRVYGTDWLIDCPDRERWIAEELEALRPALAVLGIMVGDEVRNSAAKDIDKLSN